MSAPTDRPRAPYFLLRPGPAAALPAAGIALAGWALELLLPHPGTIVPLVCGVYALVAVVKVVRRDDRDKQAVRALVEHTDPGPTLRDRTIWLAWAARFPRPIDRWSPLVMVSGLAAACVVVAVVQRSWPTALPAPFLLLWCAALGVAQQTSAERAARWLDDPPAPISRAA